ncbi:MAG: terpene cyclase/mutase family protein [Planctomycetales bacterium]|nr:terpene cyclase/mutase family protein [Planctomycetales bacterium]
MVRAWFEDLPSWGTSLIVHLCLLLVLALWMLPAQLPPASVLLEVFESEPEDIPTELPDILQPPIQIKDAVLTPASLPPISPKGPDIDLPIDPNPPLPELPGPFDTPIIEHFPGGSPGPLPPPGGPGKSGPIGGRDIRDKVGEFGPVGITRASENAVALALKWLAAHQLPDGGWDLDHRKGPGVRSQKNPGEKPSRNGATALALLPMLGAGQTHKDGQYKNVVGAGLAYLVRGIKLDQAGGALNDGGMMYAHGLGSIALCEAYAMTKDGGLAGPAQSTLNYIVSAQDPVGGGWRYQPRQPGDTSVVGWQLMALKSGHLAYLNVPPITVAKASKFLDSVQVDSGSGYGYATPGDGASTSAIGLLCRMYLGWKKDEPALERGLAKLAERGPSKSDFYYNYYATQVLFHATSGEGPLWRKWNTEMRDWLVATQDKSGAETGSWFVAGGHSSKAGGRLFCTALACMTLEVYYRHMPIYAKAAVDEDFPD